MHSKTLRAARIAALCALTLGSAAQATTVNLVPGDWLDFTVDDLLAPIATPLAWIDLTDGSPLSFNFSIGAGSFGRLTVVDAVFAGDRFDVYANGALLGTTTPSTVGSTNVGYDYAVALADPAFSRGVFTLPAGSYTVTGVMLANLDGINATQGGLRLDVSPVPEASTFALWLLGASALGLLVRRRAV